MFQPTTRLMAFGIAFAAVLSLGVTATPAQAAPPPGMRWSDTVGLTSPRSQLQPTMRRAPLYAARNYYSYAPSVVSPGVTTTAPAPATIAIRGPDGVVRNYPVVGGVQQSAPASISIQGSDGVVRSYPAVNGSYPVVSDSGVITYPCHPRR